MRTKMVTTCVISSIGDILSQQLVGSGAVDMRRVLVYALTNTFMLTPVVNAWWNRLDRTGESFRHVLGKARLPAIVATDQLIGAPIVIGYFFCSYALVSHLFSGVAALTQPGVLASSMGSKLVNDLWPTLINNWKVWPLAQTISFGFVPAELRLLWSNVVSLFWNIILSAAVNR